jgi:hypothetical protein
VAIHSKYACFTPLFECTRNADPQRIKCTVDPVAVSWRENRDVRMVPAGSGAGQIQPAADRQEEMSPIDFAGA